MFKLSCFGNIIFKAIDSTSLKLKQPDMLKCIELMPNDLLKKDLAFYFFKNFDEKIDFENLIKSTTFPEKLKKQYLQSFLRRPTVPNELPLAVLKQKDVDFNTKNLAVSALLKMPDTILATQIESSSENRAIFEEIISKELIPYSINTISIKDDYLVLSHHMIIRFFSLAEKYHGIACFCAPQNSNKDRDKKRNEPQHNKHNYNNTQ